MRGYQAISIRPGKLLPSAAVYGASGRANPLRHRRHVRLKGFLAGFRAQGLGLRFTAGLGLRFYGFRFMALGYSGG